MESQKLIKQEIIEHNLQMKAIIQVSIFIKNFFHKKKLNLITTLLFISN